ncbi:MAG: sulfate adenylyltransferase [Acidobacteriota bacterium]|jgi:ATP sulfurylase
MHQIVAPHGGTLVNRLAPEADRPSLLRKAEELPRLTVNRRQRSDLDLIAVGALSPLQGFMAREDYHRTVAEMRLANGTVWAVPVTLDVDAETAGRLAAGGTVALQDGDGAIVATMEIQDVFDWDPALEARNVYRTEDAAHPGVAYLRERGPKLVGGPITMLNPAVPEFPDHHRDPAQTRALFAERGWATVVAFQTRNPIHRAHEFLTKCALELTDGLLIHPLVGETKAGDIPADVRMRCYEVLLDRYYPRERVVLSTLPAAMRYAGPREAIWHAIIRKNYGCSHFIVGRDHAGVGNYYGTYDAQEIFDEFAPGELGIEPMKFEHTFYHTGLKEMVSNKTSPGPKEAHLFLSGTKVRAMLDAGEDLPAEFTRPEVSEILRRHYQQTSVA